jgi:hypothetical protein
MVGVVMVSVRCGGGVRMPSPMPVRWSGCVVVWLGVRSGGWRVVVRGLMRRPLVVVAVRVMLVAVALPMLVMVMARPVGVVVGVKVR